MRYSLKKFKASYGRINNYVGKTYLTRTSIHQKYKKKIEEDKKFLK
jgi:hypothetical protein